MPVIELARVGRATAIRVSPHGSRRSERSVALALRDLALRVLPEAALSVALTDASVHAVWRQTVLELRER
jgi:hypothetical protein